MSTVAFFRENRTNIHISICLHVSSNIKRYFKNIYVQTKYFKYFIFFLIYVKISKRAYNKPQRL